MDRPQNFTRPFAPHRLRLYWAMFWFGFIVCAVPFFGVGLGWLPPEPTYLIWGVLIYVALLGPLFAAWWDAPGENRTWDERAAEFCVVWFPVTASSQVVWETPWIIGNLLGKTQGMTEDDRWWWLWWGYGAADTRYLNGDTGLFGMEFVAIIGGLSLLYAWWRMITSREDVRQRLRAMFLAVVSCSAMLAVVTIYYVAEFRNGLGNLEQGFWYGFMFKFIFMNIWWVLAPFVTIPAMIRQIDYTYRNTPGAGLFTTSSAMPHPVGETSTTQVH